MTRSISPISSLDTVFYAKGYKTCCLLVFQTSTLSYGYPLCNIGAARRSLLESSGFLTGIFS